MVITHTLTAKPPQNIQWGKNRVFHPNLASPSDGHNALELRTFSGSRPTCTIVMLCTQKRKGKRDVEGDRGRGRGMRWKPALDCAW
ncbi:hypothetical protein SUGI_0921240 [Cryptomeria japonica]|nr:hypothetical protein SUGI_0921240 [Cryptomeria japonica]